MKTSLLSLTIAFTFLSISVQAETDFTFVPSLAFQTKKLTFEQEYSGTAQVVGNKADFDVNLSMLNATLGVASSKFFVSLKHETSLNDSTTGTSETDRSLNDEANIIARPESDVDVGRKDTSLTLGYRAFENVSVFIGYLDGETELKPDPFCSNVTQFEGTLCPQLNRAAFHLAVNNLNDPDNPGPEYKQTYSEDGPFIGVSYSRNVSDLGNLSVSVAYAHMDGQYRDNATPLEASQFLAFDYAGTTSGTSIGVNWVGPLGDNSAYTLDLRRQTYSMDATDQSGELAGVKLDTDETMLGLSAGIQFYF